MSKNKPFKVMMLMKLGEGSMFERDKTWRCYKSYTRRSDAEQAINNIAHKFYYDKFDFIISDIDHND